MRYTFVLSSESYPLDPEDCLRLTDAPVSYTPPCCVAILLARAGGGDTDTLLCGRDLLLAAVREGKTSVPVRICFPVKVGLTPFLAMFRYFRRKQRNYSSNCYHLDPHFLRERGLERCIRTAENAYQVRRWMRPAAARNAKFQALSESLKAGFNDAYPLVIMLHRRKRQFDSLHDGHHRLGLCLQHHLTRVAVRFRYVSSVIACRNILMRKDIYTLPAVTPPCQ